LSATTEGTSDQLTGSLAG